MPSSLPISISDSDFTIGAVSSTPMAKIATRMAEAVINTTWAEAQTLQASTSSKITTATATGGYLDPAQAPTVTAGTVSVPSVTAPNVNIPSNIDTSAIISTFETQRQALIAELGGKLTSFLSTYFPDDSADYAAAETWLRNAIADPSGLPASVRAQIWGDDQARILSDTTRASDAAIAAFASRRFPLPTDAAASAVLQIQQKSQDELAESSRKIAMMSIDMQKFNVEKLMGLRQLAMNSVLDYLKALTSGQDIASRLTGVGYDAQSKLISAASDFYRADASAKEMMSKVAQYNNSTTLEAAVKNQASEISIIVERANALMKEIQIVGQQATAMLNNLHANAGLTVSA